MVGDSWVGAQLSNEVADDNGQSHVDHQDLTHSPEVEIRCRPHAVSVLGVEVAHLEEHQDGDDVDDVGAHHVLVADILLNSTKVEESEESVGGMEEDDEPLGHEEVTAVGSVVVDNKICSNEEATAEECQRQVEPHPEAFVLFDEVSVRSSSFSSFLSFILFEIS